VGPKKNKNKNKPKKTFARTHAAAHDCAYDSPKICMWHLTKRMRMLCRAWLAGLSEASPEMVPHPLPSREQLAAMTHDLPLQCEAFVDEPELYVAHLQASPHLSFSDETRLFFTFLSIQGQRLSLHATPSWTSPSCRYRAPRQAVSLLTLTCSGYCHRARDETELCFRYP